MTNETTTLSTEPIVVEQKPYVLRNFVATDIFPMITILQKIGIKEFKEAFNKETIESVIELFMGGANKGENETSEDNTIAAVGISILPSVLDIAQVLLTNLPKCEGDFYKFLSNVSNLSIDEVKNLKMADFFQMIVDVIKKEDFKDFFKVVSKSFK